MTQPTVSKHWRHTQNLTKPNRTKHKNHHRYSFQLASHSTSSPIELIRCLLLGFNCETIIADNNKPCFLDWPHFYQASAKLTTSEIMDRHQGVSRVYSSATAGTSAPLHHLTPLLWSITKRKQQSPSCANWPTARNRWSEVAPGRVSADRAVAPLSLRCQTRPSSSHLRRCPVLPAL